MSPKSDKIAAVKEPVQRALGLYHKAVSGTGLRAILIRPRI